MPFLATGNAVEALIDAVKARLDRDATLDGLVTGVYGHVPRAARTAYPYIVLGRRDRYDDYGAMQMAGARVILALDTWSNAKGPHTVHEILARVAVLLERHDLTLAPGYALMAGSLHCVLETVFDEPDPDMPEEKLYHGHQDWEVLLEEVA